VRKSQLKPNRGRKRNTEELFAQAEKLEESGDLRSAFRLLLVGAKAGHEGCQLNLGNYYDAGTGVRRSRSAALYWYKRAYRRGVSSAATNIGVLWRNENKPKLALEWFQKAVRLGDDEAHLDIAKYYLVEGKPGKAIRHLEKVRPPNWVSEAGVEEAVKLLKLARMKLKRRLIAN
jgi:TPR repeat protein